METWQVLMHLRYFIFAIPFSGYTENADLCRQNKIPLFGISY